jgi:hypothetical protein
MENIMTVPFQTWLGRALRPSPAGNYARKPTPTKLTKCRYERVRVAGLDSRHKHNKKINRWLAKVRLEDSIVREFAAKSTEARFYDLADEWSRETMHISSASDLINDKRYQEIIGLGWDVVPSLLKDLQTNKRFWFPALAAITGVRPFDPSEINNPRRMTEAWVKWGKWKGLI